MPFERAKILGVRFGVNPNSSSLGVDVTFLLFGGTTALVIGMALSAVLRARLFKPTVVGPEASTVKEPS